MEIVFICNDCKWQKSFFCVDFSKYRLITNLGILCLWSLTINKIHNFLLPAKFCPASRILKNPSEFQSTGNHGCFAKITQSVSNFRCLQIYVCIMQYYSFLTGIPGKLKKLFIIHVTPHQTRYCSYNNWMLYMWSHSCHIISNIICNICQSHQPTLQAYYKDVSCTHSAASNFKEKSITSFITEKASLSQSKITMLRC